MAKGDIIRAQVPAPEIEYFQLPSSNQPTAGDPVFVNNRLLARGTATSTGPHKIMTHLVNEQNNSVGVMISGQIETVARGTIQPGRYVVSHSAGQGVIDRGSNTFDKIIGIYLRKPSDEKGSPTAATNGQAIIVRVTSF